MSINDLTNENEQKLKGDTDDTLIGNVGDAAKVHISNSGIGNTIPVGLGASRYDAFGLLKTASPTTLVEHPHSIGKGARYWEERIVGAASASYDNTRQAVISSTTTADADKITRQTYRNIQYFKGKSQEFKGTFNFDGGHAGVVRRIGMFTDDNGIFLELDGTTLNFVTRSNTTGSVVNTKLAQSAWTHDKLDGTGPSGYTLDLTKQQLMAFDYGHLGAGPQRLFFYIDGEKILATLCQTGNVSDRSWSKSGNLPMTTEIENTTAQAAARDFYVSCMAVDSYGGDVETGLVQVYGTALTPVSVNNSNEVIIGSLRPSPDFYHLSLLPLGIDIFTDSGSKVLYWRLLYRPTLVGDVWADLNPVAQTLSSYTSFSGGFVINQGYIDIANGQSKNINLGKAVAEQDSYLGYFMDGTPEAFILVGQTTAGSGGLFFTGSYRTFL